VTTPIGVAAKPPARIDGIYSPQLIAVDPGLDCIGWAEFRRGLRPPTAAVGLARLMAHGTLETSPRDPLALRLYLIHQGMTQVLGGQGVREIAIEVPSKAGEYVRTGKKNQAAMQNLERAIGVIIVAAEGAATPVAACRRG
jgi:Holliday junction resolvasome RuvABC endonuclease subunit